MTFSVPDGNDNIYYTDPGKYLLICLNGTTTKDAPTTCKGQYLIVNVDTGVYYTPTTGSGAASIEQYYERSEGDQTCSLTYDQGQNTWNWTSSTSALCSGTLPKDEEKNSNKSYKINWK